MGMKNAAVVCGMCIAIHGPPPTSANQANNIGIVGEYYAYVYEVTKCSPLSGCAFRHHTADHAVLRSAMIVPNRLACNWASQVKGRVMSCGVPFHARPVRRRSRPIRSCSSMRPRRQERAFRWMSTESTPVATDSVQIRGLSSPLVSATVATKELAYDGPFLILEGSTSVFPFTLNVVTALGEQVGFKLPILLLVLIFLAFIIVIIPDTCIP